MYSALLMIAMSSPPEFCGLAFTPPIEREDGTVLTSLEISHYNVYVDGIKTDHELKTNKFWSTTCDCGRVTFKTVDTDGRVSSTFGKETCT